MLLIPRVPFGWLDAPPALNRLVGVEWPYHRRPSIAGMRALLAPTK